jgi:hypothetical protein
LIEIGKCLKFQLQKINEYNEDIMVNKITQLDANSH